jgi:hypothetical protein
MYKCECGKEFTKKSSLNSHARFCDKYVKKTKQNFGSDSEYKIGENLYRCECGKEFNKSQSLNAHFSHCLVHRKGEPQKRKHVVEGKMAGWDKFSEEKIKQIHKKAGKTISRKIKSGEITTWKGRKHKEKTKQKIRLSTIKYIEEAKGKCSPRYNKNACVFFDNLSKQRNWNLQHAENGGEFHIKELGFFVDAYDEKLNIVVEYDEPIHYINGILREKDKIRQEKIIETLGCDFYRYNEQTNTLQKQIK